MIINIFFIQLISFASANPAQYQAAIEASKGVVDTVVKLSQVLKSRADEVKQQISEERKRIKNSADLDMSRFIQQVARASSRLEDAIVAGDSLLRSTLETTNKQVQLLESEYKGVRYHPFIIRAAKRKMLAALATGVEQLSAILSRIEDIKADMTAVAVLAQDLHDTIQAEWTDERVENKAHDFRLGYIGVGAVQIIPGLGQIMGAAYVAGVELSIKEWKEELRLSKEAVNSIKEKFKSLKDGSSELVNHAEQARDRYTDALRVMQLTNNAVKTESMTTDDADQPSQEEVEYAWDQNVLPQLKELRQKLMDILS